MYFEIVMITKQNIVDYNRYIRRFLDYDIDKRDEIIEKIFLKYRYQTPNRISLLDYVLEYGKKYGVSIEDNMDIDVLYEEYIIDSKWKISCSWSDKLIIKLIKIK